MQNFIIEFKNAIPEEVCNHFIDKFEKSNHKQPGRTGAGVDLVKKDSLDLHLSKNPDWTQENNELSKIILKATIEYAKLYPFILTGAISPSVPDAKTGELKTVSHEDIANMNDEQIGMIIRSIYDIDDINMQHYTQGKGGYHHWHSEHYPHPEDDSQRSLRRVLLWLIYLNDIEEGGETDFFYQEVKVRPSRGTIVMAPCGFTHTHRGSIPQSSDKYVLASWLMYKDAKQMYGPK